MLRYLPVAVTIASAVPAFAEVPQVVTDIAPLQSITARVMQGAGEPAVLLPPGADPHHYTMRPSEAQLLQDADLVISVGAGLTPWLDGVSADLAPDAAKMVWAELPGVTLIEITGAHGEGKAHEHGEAEHGEHNDHHDDHAEEGHAEDAHHEDDHDDHDAHEEHEEEGHDDHHEGHGGHSDDPHVWLSPDNASVVARAIAVQLGEMNAENAALYAGNAEAFVADMIALSAKIEGDLEGAARAHIVTHDAYAYFETRFGKRSVGAVTDSHAAEPGAAHIREIQELVTEHDVACVIAEPAYNPGLLAAVFEGRAYEIEVADPLGSSHEPGVGLYPALMKDLAGALSRCTK